jgi:hypothetical protein
LDGFRELWRGPSGSRRSSQYRERRQPYNREANAKVWSSKGDDPAAYAKTISGKLGVSITTKISTLTPAQKSNRGAGDFNSRGIEWNSEDTLMRTTALYSALIVVFLMVKLGAAAQPDSLHRTNSVVVIEGRLRHKQVYGPPGFGETPRLGAKITVYYLELKQAMSPELFQLPPSAKNVRAKTYSQVQLYCGNDFAGCDEFLREHSKHTILASGVAA